MTDWFTPPGLDLPFVIFRSKPDLTSAKIDSFASFVEGWNFGEGFIFDRSVIAKAHRALYFFRQIGLSATDAFPGVDGEIKVTAYKDEYYLQYVVSADDVSVRIKSGDRLVTNLRNVTDQVAQLAVIDALREIWSISDSSTSQPTMIASSGASTLSLSRVPAHQGSRFFAATALKEQDYQIAAL